MKNYERIIPLKEKEKEKKPRGLTELEKLMICDYSEEEGRERIQKALRDIEPIKKRHHNALVEVNLEYIENLIHAVMRKYQVSIQWINHFELSDGSFSWLLSVKRSDNHEWVGTFRGTSLYEVMAKGSIFLYDQATKGVYGVRASREEEAKELKKRLGGEAEKKEEVSDDDEEDWDG